MDERNVSLPEAGLEPRPITMQEYMDLTPEKLELISGYLIDSPDRPEERRRLLAILMVNLGLLDVVALAPEERWREALTRAYG